jgi:hypothetical protein
MTQNKLSINYLEEKKTNKITNYAGVLPLLDFCRKMKIFQFADKTLQIRSGDQGWLDSQHFLSTLLINFIGGDCMSDVDILESDTGLKAAISNTENNYIKMNNSLISKRFRKGRKRVFPSNNALANYALEFHNDSEEEVRKDYIKRKEVFIPKLNDNLSNLNNFFGQCAAFAQKNNPVNSATIDIDATIKNSNKQSAFFTYKKDERGYQPMNAFWNEQNIVLFSEFRDGNVNPSYNIPEFVEKSFSYLPDTVKNLYLRSDSAGYNFDLMAYCKKQDIKFSISAKLCKSIREEIKVVKDKEWTVIEQNREQLLKNKNNEDKECWEWAEIDHIPDNPNAGELRYIVVRNKIIEQKPLFEELINNEENKEDDNSKKQYIKDGTKYNIRVIVTNRYDLTGAELFHWHNKRCGYSEQIHSVMKNDFAGSQFPSNKFGANAFWWLMMIFSLNIIQLYKSLILDNSWKTRRMKAFRLHFIYLAGRITQRSRKLFIYVRNIDLFKNITDRIENLKWIPI